MAAIHADASAFSFKAYSQEFSSPTVDIKMAKADSELIFQFDDDCSCGKGDFIVFAEFSEVMGPIPLITVPSNIKDDPEIDMNMIIMKIMAVDYHSNPSGQFTFCQDVQLLQPNVASGWHAYVHYCTLHDLKARGFVRPLCIAYISTDLLKLHSLFPVLREQFLKATEILQYNNRQWFMEDLLKVMNLLKEHQSRYFLLKQKEEEGRILSQEEQKMMGEITINQLVHQYTEYKFMLHAVEPLMDNRFIHDIVSTWKCALVSAEVSNIDVARYMAKVRHELLNHSTVTRHNGAIRNVVILSPWGLASLLWKLINILKCYNSCSYVRGLSIFATTNETAKEVQELPAEEALQHPEYLFLLSSIIYSADKMNKRKDRQSQDSLDLLDSNILTSGKEGSSYHSVGESMNDTFSLKRGWSEESSASSKCSSESYVDVSDSDSWTDNSIKRVCSALKEEPSTFCVWNSNKLPLFFNSPGRYLLKFFHHYPKAAHHVVYSIFIGRVVVLSGNEKLQKRIGKIMDAIVPLIPLPSLKHVCTLRWHRGILVSSHISSYHMIGMCVPERLSIHDMISSKDKNLVTILDVGTQQLFGPAYSGQLLAPLEDVAFSFTTDQMLLLFLQAIATSLIEKVFLFKMSLLSSSSSSKSNPPKSPGDILKDIGLQGCDAEIVKYLFKMAL